jgi:uncharacterized protein YtpQ (UPF0354 family)
MKIDEKIRQILAEKGYTPVEIDMFFDREIDDLLIVDKSDKIKITIKIKDTIDV